MRYRAYGRLIASTQPLPELPLATAGDHEHAAPPLTIAYCLGPAPVLPGTPRRHAPPTTPWLRVTGSDYCYSLEFGPLVTFWIAPDGGWIRCFLSDSTFVGWRHLLLDHVIPRALFLAGVEALHATAVASERGVLAFLGPSGSGKSTIAGALGGRGLPLVSDDCLGLVATGDGIVAIAGYPGLRLQREAIGAVLPGAVTRPLDGTTDKHRVGDAVPFVGEEQPLNAVYLLTSHDRRGSRVHFEALEPADAAMTLVASAFRLGLEPAQRLEQQLAILARVAERVPVRRCIFPRGLDVVHRVATAILDDRPSNPTRAAEPHFTASSSRAGRDHSMPQKPGRRGDGLE